MATNKSSLLASLPKREWFQDLFMHLGKTSGDALNPTNTRGRALIFPMSFESKLTCGSRLKTMGTSLTASFEPVPERGCFQIVPWMVFYWAKRIRSASNSVSYVVKQEQIATSKRDKRAEMRHKSRNDQWLPFAKIRCALGAQERGTHPTTRKNTETRLPPVWTHLFRCFGWIRSVWKVAV